MYELIEKYKDFTIHDEKGRKHPLHITKAVNQTFAIKEQEPEVEKSEKDGIEIAE